MTETAYTSQPTEATDKTADIKRRRRQAAIASTTILLGHLCQQRTELARQLEETAGRLERLTAEQEADNAD